jgi:murein DD-endopeptidase MepM/ murein hydrolase activator NlpD
MATYYKYAEREADSYVDWGAIGKSMSDMLLEKDKIRNEKRAALDEASRQFGEVLANAPQGEHVGARQQALEYASNAAQFMRMQDILLKSGQMDLRSYTISRQNIVDDTERAFKMNQAYQQMFKEKMDRYKENKSSLYEVEAMERVEGFGNFSQSGLWINPTTGKVSVAMKELQKVNGQDVYVMAENPNNMTSIDAINGLILGKWDRYNADAVTTAIAAANGKQIQSMMSGGAITKVEDILKKPDYINAETNAINAALANPFDRMSVLTDTMATAPNGKQYRFTRDEADAKANPEAILMKIDPASGTETPQFSDEQLEKSTEWMRDDARRKYDYEKTITQKQQRMSDPNAMAAQTARAEKDALINAWKLLRSGNLQEKTAALNYLNGSPFLKEQGLGTIKFSDDGKSVVFEYVDKNGNPIQSTAKPLEMDGQPLSGTDWLMSGSEAFGNLTETDKKKHSGGDYVFDSGQGGLASTRTFTPQARTSTGEINLPAVTQDIQSQSGFITEDDPVSTANKLTQLYGKYGFTFTPVAGTIYDEVTITPTKPGAESITIPVDEPDTEAQFKNFIQQNIDEIYMKQSGATGQGAQGDAIFGGQ